MSNSISVFCSFILLPPILGFIFSQQIDEVVPGMEGFYLRHKSITLKILVTGYTKFAPDRCFGLLRRPSDLMPYHR